MHLNIQLALSGIGIAAAVALLAVGLVVTFKGSGVLNFAHGATATAATYGYIGLREIGAGTFLAVVGGLAIAVVIAALMQWLVMRRLSHAPPLAKIVATLGLMLLINAFIGAVTTNRTLSPDSLFDRTPVRFSVAGEDFVLGNDRLWTFVIATVITVVLWVVYRYSRFGLVTRALADNEQAVTLTGSSAQLLSMANWCLGALLAGAAGILLASIVPVTPTYFTVLLVTAIAASVIGRLQSFWLTYVSALVIGMVQPLIVANSNDWAAATNLVGWAEALPILVIILVVLVRGKSIPLREAATQQELPRATVLRSPGKVVIAGLILFAACFAVVPRAWADPLTMSLIGTLICLSLVVLLGYTGQVSLAQMALVGTGALMTTYVGAELGLGFPWAGVVGALAVVPVGLVMAIPAIRVRGVELAVVTLAGGLALQAMVFHSAVLTGEATSRSLDPPTFLGLELNSITHPRAFGLAVLLTLAGCVFLVARLRTSHLGQRLLAVRVNERGAAASGISVAGSKMIAFSISALLAGLAGSLLAYRSSTVTYDIFDILASVFFLGVAYIGGIGSIPGALIAGFALMPNGVGSFIGRSIWDDQWMQVIAGLLLLQMVTMHPNGLAGIADQVRVARRRRREARAAAEASAAPPARSAAPASADVPWSDGTASRAEPLVAEDAVAGTSLPPGLGR